MSTVQSKDDGSPPPSQPSEGTESTNSRGWRVNTNANAGTYRTAGFVLHVPHWYRVQEEAQQNESLTSTLSLRGAVSRRTSLTERAYPQCGEGRQVQGLRSEVLRNPGADARDRYEDSPLGPASRGVSATRCERYVIII